MKRIIFGILMLFSISAFADIQELNNPMVGSRQQGSEQQFPIPKTGQAGKVYHNGHEKNLNNPLVGSRQQSSVQQFGEPALTGEPGKTYHSGKNRFCNKPTVGGRQQSSEFIFGFPGTYISC